MALTRGLSRQNDYKQALDAIEADLDIEFALGLASEEVREKLPF